MDDSTRIRIKDILDSMRRLQGSGTAEREQIPLMAELHAIVADEQAKSAEKVERQTDELVIQTQRLVSETVILRRFTKGVFWLTIVLAVLTVVLIVIAYLEYSAKANECLIR